MSASVNVSIVTFVVVAQGIEYRKRLLRGCGVVEIHQGVAVDFLMQNGEVSAGCVGKGSFFDESHVGQLGIGTWQDWQATKD
jgi:hypothetical protein